MLVKLQNGKLINYGVETVITDTRSYGYNKEGCQINYPIKYMCNDYDYEQDYYRADVHAKTADGDNFYDDELKIYITYPDMPLGEFEDVYKRAHNWGETESISFSKSNKDDKRGIKISSSYSYGSHSNRSTETSHKKTDIEYKTELALKITNKEIPTYYWDDFINSFNCSIKKEAIKNTTKLETLSQIKIDVECLDQITNKKLELALYEFSIKDFIRDQIKKYKKEYCPCCKRYKQDVFCLHYDDKTKVLFNTKEALKSYNEIMKLDFSGTAIDEGFDHSDLEDAKERFQEVLKEIEILREKYGSF